MTDAVSDPNPTNTEAEHQTILIPTEPVVPVAPVAAPVAEDEVTPVEYDPTGDVGLDMALKFVGKAGISETHPAMVAAREGDFSILKATLATKGIQGWQEYVALGEAAYARVAKDQEAAATAAYQAVIKAAGGEQEWKAVQTWAGANADAKEKAEINEALNKGGLFAKAAVQYLVNAYNKATNVELTPADPTANAARGGLPSPNNGPLSSREYSAAVAQLNARLGGRLEGSKEYANLQARRAAYRG